METFTDRKRKRKLVAHILKFDFANFPRYFDGYFEIFELPENPSIFRRNTAALDGRLH
jgi:hypothetical protein